MGFYIQTKNSQDRASDILETPDAKAERLHTPRFIDPGTGRIAVCVVSNRSFDAAGIIYSQYEFEGFADPDDRRPKTWLSVDVDWVLKQDPKLARALGLKAAA